MLPHYLQYCQEFQEKLNDLETRLDLKAESSDLETLRSKVESIDNTITKIAEEISSTNNKVELAATEQSDKAKRCKNLIVKGVTEAENETAQQREEIVTSIFSHLGFAEAGVESITRLGQKAPNKTRSLKVILNSEETKWKIIGKATKIRSMRSPKFDCAKVFIAPDLTKLERDRDTKLRNELKSLRQSDPNGKFMIRKGKIIKVPVHQSSSPQHQPQSRTQNPISSHTPHLSQSVPVAPEPLAALN